ncbi:MAG: aldehyde:ferredoxin oxidoreductase [Proteobacteria bacterium]|nr:aldehyde:ferredoxin oxidoreductase [Pseudomonadota bacterium]
MDIKVLYINLTDETFEIRVRNDLKRYLGGTGLAFQLFQEEAKIDREPLSEEQPVVISSGFLSPYFPTATKSIAIFFSPLNNNLGESHAGGRLSLALKLAGISALVIKGKCNSLKYLIINDGIVKFQTAEHLKGLKATETATYIREKESNAGLRSILRIGPCGEKKVAFSSVVVDTYRHFGRLGLGAQFGAKNLKALIVTGSGKEEPKPDNIKGYKELFEKLHKTVIGGSMKKYHELGTAENVTILNELKALPTKNLQENHFERIEEISGESLAEFSLTRKFACAGCPLGCIHIATVRRRFDKEEEWERVDISYDYELIYSLGTLIGIGDRTLLLSMMEKIEELGLDAIYAGVFLAWVVEAFKKGLINSEDIFVDSIDFGDYENLKTVLKNLVFKDNEFYILAREGVHKLTEKYGGGDFALLAFNNAIAGYHTGYANLLGQHIVGIRNAHTDNGGYSIDQSCRDINDIKFIIDKLYEEEIFRSAFNCTGICLFARKVYDIETLQQCINSLNIDFDTHDLMDLGEEIYLKKLAFKIKKGFNLKEYKFSKRFFETTAMGKSLDEALTYEGVKYFNEMVMEKMKRRGLLP